MAEETKPFWKSKTLWANVLLVVAGVATGAADALGSGSSLTILGLVNIVLRVITKQGLSVA